ncbi:MAG: PhzF family phenazine biosynthesis protein [Alphaproteobacteria bacterium]|nr:PhzF family phenazine biosynthesis protein [Alphaproteobacteria bacterium]MDP5012540.1 PhzF family phenazine biosynthesis protein [Alphaproteobacteria bacterium]
MGTTFWLVDAFTDRAFSGNPAGVFIVDDFPDPTLMQAVAAELNWSQTAFVKRLSSQEDFEHFHIRWFSPRDEAPICGHATLASAHILWEKNFVKKNKIIFESLAGPLTVTKEENEWITLNFPKKKLVECSLPSALKQALVTANGEVEITSVMRDDLIYVVTLKNQSDLVALMPNLSLIETLDCRAVSVTTQGREGYDFESRYFAPRVGIPEDPVCGSSHCRLAPLWAERLEKTVLMAYQASKRGGFIKIDVRDDGRVTMSSKAVTVCEGNISLNLFEKNETKLKMVA